LPGGGVRIAHGIRYPACEECASGALQPHDLKPATVMPQVGVPFAPEVLAVV
jgi:hypothetical protein